VARREPWEGEEREIKQRGTSVADWRSGYVISQAASWPLVAALMCIDTATVSGLLVCVDTPALWHGTIDMIDLCHESPCENKEFVASWPAPAPLV
jgi:hypothetical protein